MPFVPMPPVERLRGRLLARCKAYWSAHGPDGGTSAGLRVRAAIWDATEREPTLAQLEEVLDAIHEYDRIDSNSIGLWNGLAEVWPNSPDYPATKAEHLQTQTEIINDKINAMIPGDNK